MDGFYDCIVIGGGIIGISTAYAFQKKFPETKILIVEKEPRIALHQTGRNSGVIHSGMYYKPASLKLKNCLRGYELLLDFARKNNIPHRLCGKLIVATESSQIPLLKNIYQRGKKNGLENILYLKDSEHIKAYEPYCAAMQAIWVPQTGVIDYTRVCQVLLEKIQNKHGVLKTSCRVLGIQKLHQQNPAHQVVQTTKGDFRTQQIVNCAGLYSDAIWKLSQETKVATAQKFQIIPFRGEYYQLKKEKTHLVKNLIYPVPNPNFPFLGVHLTKMITGQVKAGPNAVLAFSREGYRKSDITFKELYRIFAHRGFRSVMQKYWKAGLGELYRSFSKKAFTQSLQKLVPCIQQTDLEPTYSGVRAQAFDAKGWVDDFIIKKQKGVIHVINAPSPAATASFSIANHIVQQIETK